MKATELRIGNYFDIIDRSNEIHLPRNVVKMIGETHFSTVVLYDILIPVCSQQISMNVGIRDLSPIELTEEWLIKFGFEKIGKNFEKDNILILWNIIDKCYDFVHTDKGIEIKYVHQLQNLYFSLTGQELKTL